MVWPLGGSAKRQAAEMAHDLVDQLKAPVLGLYAGQDQGIGADQIEDMRTELARAGGRSRIHVYPDAHAFHADCRRACRKTAGAARTVW